MRSADYEATLAEGRGANSYFNAIGEIIERLSPSVVIRSCNPCDCMGCEVGAQAKREPLARHVIQTREQPDDAHRERGGRWVSTKGESASSSRAK